MLHLASMTMESDSTRTRNLSRSARRELRELWNLWVRELMTPTEPTVSPSLRLPISIWDHRQAEDQSSGKMMLISDPVNTMTEIISLALVPRVSSSVRKESKEWLRQWDLEHMILIELKV